MAYPTPTEIRAAQPDLTAPKYPDPTLAGLVEDFEGRIERRTGVAYVTRTVTGEVHEIARGARLLLLRHPMVQAVAGITVDGVAYTGEFTLDGRIGLVTLHQPLPAGQVAVSYTHGFSTTPHAVRRACTLWVWREATADRNPNTSNSYLVRNVELGVVEHDSTADWEAGRSTGWRDVDRIIEGLEDFRSDP